MANNFVELFPKRLHDKMIKFGINQRDLAQRIGVSEASVSNWLKGVKVPRVDKINKICEIFNCDYSELISEPTEADSDTERFKDLIALFENADPEHQQLAVLALKSGQRQV